MIRCHPSSRRDFAGASNAWAAAPGRSAAGGQLLANDPHLDFTAPTIWYLARLELPSGGVIGGTIPGMPAILIGRSERLGWGLTSSYLDDQDVLIEELNPDNPEEYDTPDGLESLSTPAARSSRSRMPIRSPSPCAGPTTARSCPASHYDLAIGHAAGPCGGAVLDGADATKTPR